MIKKIIKRKLKNKAKENSKNIFYGKKRYTYF